jgi:hypothetical protein
VSYLRSFLPWIVYAAISGASASAIEWAALTALVVAVLVIGYQVRAGSAYDALILEIGSAVFFAGMAALAFAAPHSTLVGYSSALASTALAVIAWGSLAIRRPFTLGIAKQTTPSEFWDQPLFMRTNVIITAVWAVSFTVATAILVVLVHAGADTVLRGVIQVVTVVIPLVFTIRYVAIVQGRIQEILS